MCLKISKMVKNNLLNNLILPKKGLVRNVPIIALEGHNGAGKSTLAKLISQRYGLFNHLGVPDFFLSGVRKSYMIKEVTWQASALYYLSGVASKISELSKHDDDNFYILDRSLWSTLSAHFSTDPNRLDILTRIVLDLGIENFEPDYTILLEANFSECVRNINFKQNIEEKNLDELTLFKSYYDKEKLFYNWLKKNRTSSVFIVNTSNKSIENILKETEDIIFNVTKVSL